MTAQENHRLTITIQRKIYGHATDIEIWPLNEESVFQAFAVSGVVYIERERGRPICNMSAALQCWHIRGDGQAFDASSVYDQYPSLFTIKIHHGGKFTDMPNRKYVDGEVTFVDLVDSNVCKVDILDTIMYQILEIQDKMFYHYKIPLKSLDIGLRTLANDSDMTELIKHVKRHKTIYVFAVESEFVDPMKPTLDITESDLEVLDFDSFESDVGDETESAGRKGLRKLRKHTGNTKLKNNFFVGKEFPNRDLAKDMIRAHAVETRRNIMIVKNDKIRVRAECFGMVPVKVKMTKDLIIHSDKLKAVTDEQDRKKKEGNIEGSDR
ncbi:transposase, MuDR [Artemisia annua]|uniref:Transposase, MuDR n=1 Tax=Artemisia annua TaxID=35608 RepID=A0A2U1KSC5_ARTAN|nr:transposase, MuDR [Artemisia annua]